MGMTDGDLRFLASAKRMGLQGGSACTLGRQFLFLSQKQVDRTLQQYNLKSFTLPPGGTAFADEEMLPTLGFEKVDIMDASDFEGASVIHDLNRPIPREMHELYDLVLDCGTLEHIFNFPTALESIMRITKVGGHILLSIPANNHCGHGFYQFSPELFFRVFSPDRGFELLRIYMNTEGPFGRWHNPGQFYHIADPASVHGRVQLLNSKPSLVMIHARKIEHFPENPNAIQQSDYVSIWAEDPSKRSARQDGPLKAFVRANFPVVVSAQIGKGLKYIRQKREGRRWRTRARLSNRELYVPVKRWDITTVQALEQTSGADGKGKYQTA
jgi:SAM-dependent methyltransferase